MQDDGVILVAGFPRVDGMATRRNMQATISNTVQNAGFISFNTQAFGPRRVVSTVIPSKRANGRVWVRCNVEEVDVHGSLSEVVVLVAKVVFHVLSLTSFRRCSGARRET